MDRHSSARYTFLALLAALACVDMYVAIAPVVVHAANDFVPLAQTPGGSKLGQLYGDQNFAGFINGLFKFGIAIGAIAAVLRLAYAGYLYMGESDMWSQKGAAKVIIQDVTLGLLLLLSIYLILYQINPDIIKLNALKKITPVQQSAPQSSGSSGGSSDVSNDGSYLFNSP
ncbi:hypothetical protein A3D71_03280 [Candidatus Kaiserbacteria bacterium RIFCSPHIGHO2_02_FULL_55_20]|uniref:Uncharacterized protein n=1 Tax=Candidatus Kaiserbacteria bacterium RIFCSPHIGHO2_02_FULL_55_20 TaxID=1798497 RepID=A0A1F6DXA6_9BACT|nr:MAG: hypothetical protein A2680_02305 [Candidatus Kaiserbacteria bacterium RIFCSPHIGHO2_01_FULL_55_37]OGG66055.1 MAG: hypothetical protein A3D71_03280 [Candidatus Kaiserbacteria bacterium RIFCSPHIGHO2_02_FULL_55_20]